MMRERLADSLKSAMKAKEARQVSTLRLILAALKDRDIAARGEGNDEGISEDDILGMLGTMVRQRREAIKLYEQGGRDELAAQEREEIGIIETYLPRQLDEAEILEAVQKAVAKREATTLKDMGPIMADLRSDFAGRMNFGRASQLVKEQLS